MRRRCSVLLFAALALIFVLAPCTRQVSGEEDRREDALRTSCPALIRSPKISGSIGAPKQTDLLIHGIVTVESDDVGTVRIRESYYGDPESNVLRFSSGALHRIPAGEQILVLEARTRGDLHWALVEAVPANQPSMLSAKALGEARTALHALGASLILVGREIALAETSDIRKRFITKRSVRTVEVDQVILGSNEFEKQRIRVYNSSLTRWLAPKLPLRPKKRIYVFGTDGPHVDPPVVDSRRLPKCYASHVSVGHGMLARIRASIKKRETYPIVMSKETYTELSGGAQQRVRGERIQEICFQGSLEDALKMLESTLEGGYELAVSSLGRRPEEARGPLLKRTRTLMMDHEVGDRGRHKLLEKMIRALTVVERKAPSDALNTLVVEYVDQIRSPSAPAPPSAYASARASESHRTDVNRALIWLLEAMSEESARRHVEHIRSARDELQGPWRREMQFALDHLGVEDEEALVAGYVRGLAKPKGIERKVGVLAGHRGAVKAMFYSDGGSAICTIGRDNRVCTWDAHSLEPTGNHDLPVGFEVDQVHASGNQILCLRDEAHVEQRFGANSSWPHGRPARVIDALTGSTRSTFTLKKEFSDCTLLWTHDPLKLLVCLDGKFIPLDARDGRTSNAVSYKDSGSMDSEFEEDGLHIYCYDGVAKNQRLIDGQRINMKTGATRALGPDKRRWVSARKAGLLPDGKHFWYAAPGLRVFERDTCKEVLHLPLNNVSIRHVSPSPDGRYFAVLSHEKFPRLIQKAAGSEEGAILRIVDARSGAVALAYVVEGGGDGVRVSPDGKRVTVLTGGGKLMMWRMPEK